MSWLAKYTKLPKFLTAESNEFKNEHDRLNRNKDLVEIEHFPCDFRTSLETKPFKTKPTAIDRTTYSEIHKVLAEYKIESEVNNVCSILKQHSNMSILLKINTEVIDVWMNFHKEFYELFKLIEDDNIGAVKIYPKRKGSSLTIQNENLLKTLFRSFTRIALKSPFAPQIITEYEEGLLKETFTEKSIVDSAIFALAQYFIIRKRESNPELALTRGYSNKLMKLIFELLAVTDIIDLFKIESEPKDFIRKRIERHIGKKSHLAHYYNKEKINQIFDIDMVFGNVDLTNKMIKNVERLRNL